MSLLVVKYQFVSWLASTYNDGKMFDETKSEPLTFIDTIMVSFLFNSSSNLTGLPVVY